MSPEEEKCLIDTYLTEGWVVELNEGKHLWFSKYIDETTEWMRDYDKEAGTVNVFNSRAKDEPLTT